MITSWLILIITLHWGFATGATIAARTEITIGQFLMGMLFLRYTLYSYGL